MRRRWHRQVVLDFMRQVTPEEQQLELLQAGVPTIEMLDERVRENSFQVPNDLISSGSTIADLLSSMNTKSLSSDPASSDPPIPISGLASSQDGDIYRMGIRFSTAPEYKTYMKFELPKPYFEFNFHFTKSADGNGGEIRVWNLDDETIQKIRVEDIILISAGHRDAPPIQRLMPGKIDKVHSVWEGSDRITTIVVTDSGQEWMTRQAWYSAAPGINAKAALYDLARQLAIPIRHFHIAKDVIFPQGLNFTPYTTVRMALKRIASAAASQVFVMNGGLFIQPQKTGGRFMDAIVSPDSWYRLIGRPEKIQNDDAFGSEMGEWVITTLLDAIFEPGRTFRVLTPNELFLLLEIIEAEFICDRNRFYTVMKCAEVQDSFAFVPGLDLQSNLALQLAKIPTVDLMAPKPDPVVEYISVN